MFKPLYAVKLQFYTVADKTVCSC